jgi:hypothetical protein
MVMVMTPAAEVFEMMLLGWLSQSGSSATMEYAPQSSRMPRQDNLSSVKDGGKCFLVFDEGFEMAHRHLKVVKELRALLEGEGLVVRR